MKSIKIFILIGAISICWAHQSLQALERKNILKATAVAALSILAGTIATDPNPTQALYGAGKAFGQGAVACNLVVNSAFAGQYLGRLDYRIRPGIGYLSGGIVGNAFAEIVPGRSMSDIIIDYPPRNHRKHIAESFGCVVGILGAVNGIRPH